MNPPPQTPFADLTAETPRRRRREEPRDRDEDDEPRRRRRRDERDDENERPVRSPRRRDAGPTVVRWALVAGLFSAAGSIPLALVSSQYAPVFGGWVTAIARPFSPARVESIPVHLIGFGLLALVLGAGIGAGVGYLRSAK